MRCRSHCHFAIMIQVKNKMFVLTFVCCMMDYIQVIYLVTCNYSNIWVMLFNTCYLSEYLGHVSSLFPLRIQEASCGCTMTGLLPCLGNCHTQCTVWLLSGPDTFIRFILCHATISYLILASALLVLYYTYTFTNILRACLSRHGSAFLSYDIVESSL